MGLSIVLLMAIRCLRVTVPELLEENICRLYHYIWKEKPWFPKKIFLECFLVMSTASLIYDKGDGQSAPMIVLLLGWSMILNTKIVTSSMSNLLFFLWHLPLGINQWIGLYIPIMCGFPWHGWMTIPHSSHVYYSHIMISLMVNAQYLHYNPYNCGWLCPIYPLIIPLHTHRTWR